MFPMGFQEHSKGLARVVSCSIHTFSNERVRVLGVAAQAWSPISASVTVDSSSGSSGSPCAIPVTSSSSTRRVCLCFVPEDFHEATGKLSTEVWETQGSDNMVSEPEHTLQLCTLRQQCWEASAPFSGGASGVEPVSAQSRPVNTALHCPSVLLLLLQLPHDYFLCIPTRSTTCSQSLLSLCF